MAHFALMWKARTIEKYRRNYESEKINSILISNAQIPKQSLSQRFRHYRYDTQKRISRTFRRWCPEGSSMSNLLFYLRTDQTFPNFVLKSVLGFVGGIVLTYLCFMFFVFQLSISLIHATIMSSIIGVLLTLGLAFSYRIRCLVFLLIPQFFSRVGRYSLTCYALVLILTGPATNTLKNSEVLSESLACGQEQVKSSVSKVNSLMTKPLNSLKDSIKLMIDKLRNVAVKVKQLNGKINRLVLNIAQVIQSGFLWLNSLSAICNEKLSTPYQQCITSLNNLPCKSTIGKADTNFDIPCDPNRVKELCSKLKPNIIRIVMEHLNGDIVPVIKKRLKSFTERITHMFKMQVRLHHSYSFSSNTSRSASQVAAGIVTEIRRRADPLLTWLSWSSCVTSLFLLLIIFRAKNYQHMFETRSRFDNRYITKEIRDLDLKRLREGRETILPLNRRERAKYVTTTSFRLVASEKIYLNRSVVFMAITTFKLLIHMVADYSLYWVLMTIRYHGSLQTTIHPRRTNAGFLISGSGPTADLLKSILSSLGVLLDFPASTPVSCLPNPYPPDLKRYTQIGVLILLLWFFAMFEPYGLRLRHVVMGHYQPDRAKSRALWLYNHILRTRGGFMKFARRKLHRTYKYRTEEKFTFQRWLDGLIPFSCLWSLLGTRPEDRHCFLCGTIYYGSKSDTKLIRCKTINCPGVYCTSCFSDIGELCTICLSPKDYGDLSDVSLEKGSSDDSGDDEDNERDKLDNVTNFSIYDIERSESTYSSRRMNEYDPNLTSKYDEKDDKMLLLPKTNQRLYCVPEHDDKIDVQIEDPIKKITILRHKKYKVNHRSHINKSEFDASFCKYCHTEYCESYNNRNFEPDKLFFTSFFLVDFTYGLKDNPVAVFNAITKVVKNNKRNIQISSNNAGRNKSIEGDKIGKNKNKFQSNSFQMQKKDTGHKSTSFYKMLSELMMKSSKYSIHLAGNNVKIDKTTKSPKKKCKIKSKIHTKYRKAQKSSAPVNFNVDKVAKTSPLAIKCRKRSPKHFIINSCHCACDHRDIINIDKLNKIRGKKSKFKKPQDKLSSKTSESSCACYKRIRAFFSDIIRIFRSNTGFPNFNDTIKSPPCDMNNHKRRKKKKRTECIAGGKDDLSSSDTRNYRISAYLAEQDWMKTQCRCNGLNNVGDKVCGDAEVSDALAMIKSRSKNLANNLKYKQKTHQVLQSNVQELPPPEILTSMKKTKKNELTFNELWRKIGFGYLSDSSSSSFINNIYRTTNKIFVNEGRKIGRTSSENLSRRLKYYGSLGNDDFDKILKEGSIRSRRKKEGIDIKKYPENVYDRIHVVSSSGKINRGAKDGLKKSSTNFCKKLWRLKGCISDHVHSSCGNSISFFKNLCSKLSNKEKDDKRLYKITGENKACQVDCSKVFKEDKNVEEGVKKVQSYTTTDKDEKELDVQGSHVAKNLKVKENKVDVQNNDVGKDLKVKENKDVGLSTTDVMKKICDLIINTTPDTHIAAEVTLVAKVNKGTMKRPVFPADHEAGFKHKSVMTTVDEGIKTKESKDIGVMIRSTPEHFKMTADKSTLVFPAKETASKTSEKGTMVVPVTKEPTAHSRSILVNKTALDATTNSMVNKSAQKEEPTAHSKSILASKTAQAEEPTAHSKSILASKTVHEKDTTTNSKVTKEPTAHSRSILVNKTALNTTTNSMVNKSAQEEEPTAHSKSILVNKTVHEQDTTTNSKSNVDRTATEDLASTSPTAHKTIEHKTTDNHGTQAICGCQELRKLLQQNKSIQVRNRNKSKSIQAEHSRIDEAAEDVRSSSSESAESVESDCPCKGSCSDPETGEKNKTCTCATQYLDSDGDSSSQMRLLKEFIATSNENLDREIYEFTSVSCFESKDKFSSSIDTDEVTVCTDPTICGLAYTDNPRRRRTYRRDFVTKANQCTGTEHPQVCDVSTPIQDWWSPLVEKKNTSKKNKRDRIGKQIGRELRFGVSVKEIDGGITVESGEEITLEKKGGDYMMGDQLRQTQRTTKVTMTNGKFVTFRSQAQIIPAGVEDILSPSRYLLESQRYYNELFNTKLYAPHLFPVTLTQAAVIESRSHSPPRVRQTRRNHKTKRLEECYSSRKQVITPRRRCMEYEWIRDSGEKNVFRSKKLRR